MNTLASRRLVSGCAASALIAVVMGALGQVVFAQGDGAINACVNARGALRIVAPNEPCRAAESPLSWNVQADATAPQIVGSLNWARITSPIYSISWGNRSNAGSGGGGPSGHPTVSNIGVVKDIDLMTPLLLNASFAQQQVLNVTIVLFRTGTTMPLVTYVLDTAAIEGVSFGAVGGQVTESVSFIPGGRVITTVNIPSGGLTSACWDISNGIACN